MSPRGFRFLYGAAALLAALLFLALLREPFRGLPPETDLWWMMPAFSYHLEGRSGWGLWAFLLGPAPSYFAFPSHKLILWLLHVLRLPLSSWAWATALIHAANAALLARLCRTLGLSRRASALAGITFLCLFSPFHAIVWLPASQHVLTLFTILATLLLFLATERRITETVPGGARIYPGTKPGTVFGHWVPRKEARVLYGLTAAFVVVGSIENAALVAPLLMGTWTLLQRAGTPRERVARYLRWVPVFFAASLYPIGSHCFSYVKPLMTDITAIPLAPFPKALLLLSCVAILLGVVGALLWMLARHRHGGRIAWTLLAAAAGAGILLLALRDSRQVLLPYHALVPFTTVLASFLNPFALALEIDSASKYHYLPAGISTANLLLTVLLLAVFAAAVLRHKRQLILFGVWYVTTLLYLLLHRHAASSMPFHTPSRYFPYVAPVFCVVFCAVAVHLYLRLARRAGWRGWTREAGLLLLFAFFWVPNLLAVRVALLRGRMVNAFYIYDDIRAVSAIGEDLFRHRDTVPGGARINPGTTPGTVIGRVSVSGVAPLAFRRKWDWPVPAGAVQDRLFRRLAEESWGPRGPVREIRVNAAADDVEGARSYRIEEGRVLGPGGPIEPFCARFEAGVAALGQRRYEEAARLLEEAARERPFFLNYLLTPEGRLSDLQWITEGADLEDWLTRLGHRWRRWSIAPPAKWDSVWASIRREVQDYERCLLYLGYLRWREGRGEEGLFWLSRLRLLERDPDRLGAALLSDPLLHADPEAPPFLTQLRAFLSRPDSLPWRKNDYGFARWLARTLLGWDIRSGWDRQFPEPP